MRCRLELKGKDLKKKKKRRKKSFLPVCHFETINTRSQPSFACLPARRSAGPRGHHCMGLNAAGWLVGWLVPLAPWMSFAGAFCGPNPTRPFLLSTRGMSLLYFLLSVFIKRETWDTFCMVTLLEDATSLYNKYLLSVFYNLAHFLYPLCRFPRAVLYLQYRVLVCVFTLFPSDVSFPFPFSFISVCLLDLLLGYTVVPL